MKTISYHYFLFYNNIIIIIIIIINLINIVASSISFNLMSGSSFLQFNYNGMCYMKDVTKFTELIFLTQIKFLV